MKKTHRQYKTNWQLTVGRRKRGNKGVWEKVMGLYEIVYAKLENCKALQNLKNHSIKNQIKGTHSSSVKTDILLYQYWKF